MKKCQRLLDTYNLDKKRYKFMTVCYTKNVFIGQDDALY